MEMLYFNWCVDITTDALERIGGGTKEWARLLLQQLGLNEEVATAEARRVLPALLEVDNTFSGESSQDLLVAQAQALVATGGPAGKVVEAATAKVLVANTGPWLERFCAGVILVEPSATTRKAIMALPEGQRTHILDPQHGGSLLPDETLRRRCDEASGLWPHPAACTAAVGYGSEGVRQVVLREGAGLDDYLAAAVLVGGRRLRPKSLDALAEVAQADNVSWEGLPNWAPGQEFPDVTASYPGLARLCCSTLPTMRKVALLREWLEMGWIASLRPEEGELLGASLEHSGHSGTWAEALDRVARKERDNYSMARVDVLSEGDGPVVAVVLSNMTGLSGGRGGPAAGYHYAPVVVAASRMDNMHHLITVAVAPNARNVRLNFEGLVATLNSHEVALGGSPGWGGNPKSRILGSPKPGGSMLSPPLVGKVVAQHVQYL